MRGGGSPCMPPPKRAQPSRSPREAGVRREEAGIRQPLVVRLHLNCASLVCKFAAYVLVDGSPMQSPQSKPTLAGVRPFGRNPFAAVLHSDGVRSLVRRASAIAVFAAVLGIDVGTKSWAAAALTEPVRIADWLYLVLYHNSGLFLGTVPVSAGYWVCVCAATVWFGWRAWRSTSAATTVCLAVVLAGLTGNAIGQAQGAVVDFIGFGPIRGNLWLFVNVADLAMVLGVLALAFFLVSRMACRARVP